MPESDQVQMLSIVFYRRVRDRSRNDAESFQQLWDTMLHYYILCI